MPDSEQSLKFTRYGNCGLLIQGLALEEMNRLCERLEKEAPEAFLEYIRGFERLLLLFQYPIAQVEVERWLRKQLNTQTEKESERYASRLVEIPVIYDGADLKEVAEKAGLSEAELITLHTGPTYTVRMMGFSPGFPYLDGLDERLWLPRRARPRTRIAAGSVAIGGGHAGIYSVASSGGWHILGRTNQNLFSILATQSPSPNADQIFLLKPGDSVRFFSVEPFNDCSA